MIPDAERPSRPDDLTLSPGTSMGRVTLRVGDLGLMSSYYERAFALEALEEGSRQGEVHRVLGRGSVAMMRLVQTPGLPVTDPREAGLFHTAFLFEDQQSLAATVVRASRHRRSRFVGSSDHGVSEAFYFTDPEGNGVELYTDRPRDQWQRARGQILMNTVALDPTAYLENHLTDEALAAGSGLPGLVGHVHLQVGDLSTAEAFYVDVLGFDATLREYRGALFVSAGGYHHHLAMNVWNSAGAGPRSARLGLGDVSITVPLRDDLDALVARLRAAGIPSADDGRSVVVHDPWGTQVTISTDSPTTEELLIR
jgi:catechol 2,3-dioxygenase